MRVSLSPAGVYLGRIFLMIVAVLIIGVNVGAFERPTWGAALGALLTFGILIGAFLFYADYRDRRERALATTIGPFGRSHAITFAVLALLSVGITGFDNLLDHEPFEPYGALTLLLSLLSFADVHRVWPFGRRATKVSAT